jgi:flagellar basal-body rod modification protein FlgD
MSTSPVSGSSASQNQTQNTNNAAAQADPLANQNVFLQLLVTQLKYQDPQNPADGTQFITQLAQFTEVSNTTQMTSDLDSIKAALAAQSSATAGTQGK